MTRPHATFTAAVIRPRVSWFAAPGAEPVHTPTPDWARVDLARLVLAAQTVWFRGHTEGTVLWQCSEKFDPRRLVAQLRENGCTVSDKGVETGWFTVMHEARPTVHLGIGSMIYQARTTISDLRDEAKTVVARFARYGQLTGAAWRGTGGLSGCASIRSLHESKRGGSPLWRWDKAETSGVTGIAFELRGSRHRRDLRPAELDLPYVHQFDVRAQYLAAAGVSMLGWSAPVQSGPREFDPGRAGYWTVQRDQLDGVSERLVRPGTTPLVPLTTPVMIYLAECGIRPTVYDSMTSDRTGRYLREWAELLTAALKTLDEENRVDAGVLVAVKDTYARTSGMVRKPGGRIFRPDWGDVWMDTAKINMTRKVDASGLDPLRWNVDSVYIATDRSAAEIGQALGASYLDGTEVFQVGKFRHIATTTVGEYLEQFPRERVPA